MNTTIDYLNQAQGKSQDIQQAKCAADREQSVDRYLQFSAVSTRPRHPDT
jgi:hypothetical protein